MDHFHNSQHELKINDIRHLVVDPHYLLHQCRLAQHSSHALPVQRHCQRFLGEGRATNLAVRAPTSQLRQLQQEILQEELLRVVLSHKVCL